MDRSALFVSVRPFLKASDDPAFWQRAIAELANDVEAEIDRSKGRHDIYVTIGACSHWVRPHQTRWKAAGGFAWPSGYGDGNAPWSTRGLPQFDWSRSFLWDGNTETWRLVSRFRGKRKLIFRAALPTRTLRHNQAAIHTTWSPGAPGHPRKKALRIYGFRKRQGFWDCVASSDL